MKKYFELRENGEILYGVVENIPDYITIEEIKKRIEVYDENASIKLIDDDAIDNENMDIEVFMYWDLLDK